MQSTRPGGSTPRSQRHAVQQEDMRRGYFDDFKDLRETGGKMFPASQQLSEADTSPQLTPFKVGQASATHRPYNRRCNQPYL